MRAPLATGHAVDVGRPQPDVTQRASSFGAILRGASPARNLDDVVFFMTKQEQARALAETFADLDATIAEYAEHDQMVKARKLRRKDADGK